MTTIWFTDTETGGLDPYKHSILSVALVKWVDGVIIKEKEWFVEERVISVTLKALEINQIDLRTIKGLDPYFVRCEIKDFMNLDPDVPLPTLGGHNTPFDRGFLEWLYRQAESTYPFHYRLVDTQIIARYLWDAGIISPQNAGLEALCTYFNIPNDRYHTALGDAVATAQLYTKLIDIVKGVK